MPKDTEKQQSVHVVEDDPFLSKVLVQRLKKEGVNVVLSKDGEQAIKNAAEQSFDLMLLDLILPKKNGFEVLEAMNKKGDKTPVVVLSNLGQTDDIEHVRKLGAKEYLVKADHSISEILDVVKKYTK